MFALRTRHDVGLFDQYQLVGYDEMFAAAARPRPHYAAPARQSPTSVPTSWHAATGVADLMMRHRASPSPSTAASRASSGSCRSTPIPRIIPADEWDRIERGLKQRIRALNLFLHDIYHDRLILKDRVVPAELVLGASGYRREMHRRAACRSDMYIHICGTDLIRDADGQLPRPRGQRPHARRASATC